MFYYCLKADYSKAAEARALIASDFEGFSNIDLGTNAPANYTLLGTPQKNYALHHDHYTIFHVILTNYDPAQNVMKPTSSSTIYILAAQGGTVKFGF